MATSLRSTRIANTKPHGAKVVCISLASEYDSSMADYYDLIVGLHPDEAIREVVESAKVRPVLVVPCCNFGDRSKKLGSKEMVEEITKWLREN